MKDIHIRLEDDDYDRLKRTAKDLGTSMSDVISTLLQVRTRSSDILGASRYCRNCKYEDVKLEDSPCNTCGIQEGRYGNWEAKKGE